MLAYMRNNGTPKKIFNLKDDIANSPNHEFLKQQLMGFGAVQNRHGNLIVTGNVDIQDLEDKMKDMEYENLAKYVTNNIAYALGIPATRLPYSLDGGAKSDAGGLAESGYWKMIEADQRKIENLLNTQVFQPMGVKVRFKKAHRIDDLREVQAWSMKADAVTKLDGILAKFGKRLSDKKLYALMELDDDDVEDAPEPEFGLEMEPSGLSGQNMLNHQELGRGDSSLKRDRSRTAAVNNPKGVAQDGN
jgi:hypothetical protein